MTKVSAGGNNHGAMTTATNLKTEQQLADFSGSEILGVLNATKKLETLLGGRPNENITCPETVYTVGTNLTKPTRP